MAAGSDANSAAAGNGTSRYISGPINSFHVDGDNLYYYDVLSGSIVSVDVAGSGTGGGTGSAGSGQGRGLSADLFTNTSYVDSINVAAGMLYGRMSGGDTGYSYFRLDMAQRAGGQAIVDDEVYTSSNTGSVVQYGSKLYYIERDASGEQNIYAINTSVNVNEPVAVALHLENAGMDFGGSGGAPGNNPSGGSGAGSAQSTEQGTQNTTQSPQDNTQNAPNDGQNTSNGGQNASIGGQNAPNDASDNEPVSALQGSAGAVGSERSDAVIYGFSPVGGAILYGIPADEQIIYITDRLIITNDYIYARLYTVPEIEVYSAPGVVNAPWAVVHGSARYHKFMELRAQAGAGSGAGSAGEDGDGGAQSDSAEWRPGAVGEADDGTAGAAADGTANGAPSGTDTGESSADGVSPGGETSDVEPGEAGGELREGAGEDNGESGAADNGAGGAGGTSGSAGGGADAEIPENVVFPEVLADNGMHMWHGMSQFRQFDDRLYFSSQAGFFSTDIGFMTATFVNGDGPEIGEDFLVSGDKAFFRRSIVSGESGLYMLDLKSGQQRRIFGGNAAGFDVSANFIYFTDADEGAMYMFDTDSDAPAVRMFEDGGLTGDIVICREGGGLVVRSPENGFALYVMDSDSFNVRKITEGGADVLAYYRDFIYYEAWDMPGTFIRLDVKRAGADGARSADSTNGANDTNVANGANNGTNGANGANNGTNNDGNADAPDSENDADDASASG
ncbi:MAG: DUF5050 domain-containing protein [Oscillospiraceae bacterium]|nr:DUF5050 domain-containing protein [Oscillospiraceae bacterium]